MICPNCNTETNGPYQRIIKREGKHYITYSCFKCSTVLMEKETRFGLGARIIFWIIAIPLSMFIFVLAMSVFPRQVGEYIIVTILIAVMLIILNFIVKQRKMEKANIESVKNREIAQNDNSNAFKLNDPLMNRIAENAEIQINKKITRKKIKYISGIFIAMIIVFNIYPSIIKIKNNFTKMNKLNTGAANKARDLRGGQLAERLNINYDVHFAYPVDLNDELIKSSDEFFKEDRVDYKKDVLGKEIKLSDFNYKSSGKEFELCLNDGEYSKCWRGKDGRAF